LAAGARRAHAWSGATLHVAAPAGAPGDSGAPAVLPRSTRLPPPFRHQVLDYIRNERTILDTLHHPGIAQLYFTFQVGCPGVRRGHPTTF
jgi:hypothetical protein